MSNKKFRILVEESINNLPNEFAEKLDNIIITVSNFPTAYQLHKAQVSSGNLLLGLYEGVPRTRRGIYYSSIPDKITIFKIAIEQISNSDEQIKANIRQTVIHEIGHHFGLSDDELEKNLQ